MNATSLVLAVPPRQHASRDIYEHFLRERHRPGTTRQFLQRYDCFVQHYPDLETWFHAPLVERVGRLPHEPRARFPIVNAARPYLTFLALHSYAWFDWEWLIASPSLYAGTFLASTPLAQSMKTLLVLARQLGFAEAVAERSLAWTLHRVFLHTATTHLRSTIEESLNALDTAISHFSERSDLSLFFGSARQYQQAVHTHRSHLQTTRAVLYHHGLLNTEPRRNRPTPFAYPNARPTMTHVIERYVRVRSANTRPHTIKGFIQHLHGFVAWLVVNYPTVDSFAQVTREQVLHFGEALNTLVSAETGRRLSARTKEGYISILATFFGDVAAWGWEEVPAVPLLGKGDIPKRTARVPRYIPASELTRLMSAILDLECPYQRTALLVARWSGARRDEIRRLEYACLDRYPDGTPRLRIPAGKTYQERLVPLNEEAAQAIRWLQAYRAQEPARGFHDDVTGTRTRKLFVHHGKLFSAHYLFELALREACKQAGLVTPEGKATVTAHRFRHTVGTQLAEKGARLHTIMKVLGHTSAGMSMVYAQISDREVLRDYESVLGPGAVIAGPYAEHLHSQPLATADIDWLKTNFFKTELELGHCLRLPQEGPCECDLYLTCAKFVTTPAYASRLRERRRREIELTEDARQHGWEREIERHACTVQRIEVLLQELQQSIEEEEER